MPVIMNKLRRRRVIQVSEKKSVALLSKGTAKISISEAESPTIKELKKKGEIIVLMEEDKKDKKPPVAKKEKDK